MLSQRRKLFKTTVKNVLCGSVDSLPFANACFTDVKAAGFFAWHGQHTNISTIYWVHFSNTITIQRYDFNERRNSEFCQTGFFLCVLGQQNFSVDTNLAELCQK